MKEVITTSVLGPSTDCFLARWQHTKKKKDAASQNENQLEDCEEIGQYSTAVVGRRASLRFHRMFPLRGLRSP